jgi:hypothetical protein
MGKARKAKPGLKESTLAPDEAGNVLDRLLLLEQVIGPGDVLQVLQDTDCLDTRRCKLTREVTFWVVLAMGILTDLPIRQVFKACRRLCLGAWTPHRSSLCVARQRLGLAPLRVLFDRLVRLLASPLWPDAFYQGLRLMALDGTVLDVPDSDANAAAFGYPQGGRGRGAFPQVRKLSLVEVGTHVELAFVVKGLKEKGSGEKSMAPALFRHLRPDMLLVWDRGFLSYGLWQQAALHGQLLARVSDRLVLRPTQTLADGSYLAKLYPCESLRNKDRHGLVVRVIRYKLSDPRRVGHEREHVLLTTLVDAAACPAEELIVLYHKRWEAELTFDEQKTHQDPKRVSKPAQLRSETPLGVLQEIYALSIGHYVTRALMAQAAGAAGLQPEQLSFVGCLQVIRCRMPELPGVPAAGRADWYEALLREMGQERLEPRRNRVNPRVVRQKMSKFKKKRAEHRHLPPLQKTFAQTIVMLR